eukprot:TRINITY_DN59041_c0_g1_i1.p1 TRINITY_DN59041_c0_g1~~TRINITY_DN59041_c0_g1_i1.p1  ORF type:complete len:410 (-),score=66.74 TRINITY_DN59041_c0_g1_i1:18-1247(-)
MAVVWSLAPLARLALCSCVVVAAAKPIDTEGVCSSGDNSPACQASTSDSAALVGAVLAEDSLRLHLSHVLPTAGRSAQLRLGSHVQTAALAALPSADESDPLAAMGLVVITFDGKANWFRSSGDRNVPLETLGSVRGAHFQGDGGQCASVALSDGSGFLALGHTTGNVSLWRYQEPVDKMAGSWTLMAMLKQSHHDWESARSVKVSEDGSLILASTEDSVVLWQVDTEDRAVQEDAQELLHFHGGKYAVSASMINRLSSGAWIVVVAYTQGTVEGWFPEGNQAQVRWTMQRQNEPRFVAVAAGAPYGGERDCLVGGTADGRIQFWHMRPNGDIDEPGRPFWEVPSRSSSQPSAFRLILYKATEDSSDETLHIAAGVGSDVVLLDAANSGKERLRARGGRGGVVMAISWH